MSHTPGPAKQKPAKPMNETLFDLHVKQVQLQDGWVLYNDVRTPLAMQGADFRLALNAGGDASKPIYVGALDWKDVQFAAKRYVPVPVNLSAKFTIHRDGFTVEQALLARDGRGWICKPN